MSSPLSSVAAAHTYSNATTMSTHKQNCKSCVRSANAKHLWCVVYDVVLVSKSSLLSSKRYKITQNVTSYATKYRHELRLCVLCVCHEVNNLISTMWRTVCSFILSSLYPGYIRCVRHSMLFSSLPFNHLLHILLFRYFNCFCHKKKTASNSLRNRKRRKHSNAKIKFANLKRLSDLNMSFIKS